MTNIAIFASGAGSNARKIIEYFANHTNIRVALVLSNNRSAGVLDIAKTHQIPIAICNKVTLQKEEEIMPLLHQFHIDFIALAGFMVLIPAYLTVAFQNRIINIHPALLPKYGGKGMYGMHVHEAVFQQQEKESGISIHFVNAKYDDGDIIFQEKINIENCENATEIASKVLACEHANYAKVIEKVVIEFREKESE